MAHKVGWIWQRAVNVALGLPSPKQFSPGQKDTNACFVKATLTSSEADILIVRNNKGILSGYRLPREPNTELVELHELTQLQIQRYKGPITEFFSSPTYFLAFHYLRLNWFFQLGEVFAQKTFETFAKLQRERMETLELALQFQMAKDRENSLSTILSDDASAFHLYDFVSKKMGPRYLNLPEKIGDEFLGNTAYHLRSFVATGEVIETESSRFQIQASAMATLERFKLEQNKSRHLLTQGWLIVFLTAIIAIASVWQLT